DGPVLPALDLGEGVRLRGRIDRVDIAPSGEAVVYDYKGKNASPAAKWLPEGSVQVALYMIACEQLLGLRAVGGFYQPLTGGDLRPAACSIATAGCGWSACAATRAAARRCAPCSSRRRRRRARPLGR